MTQTILVHADASPEGLARVRAAQMWAEAHDGRARPLLVAVEPQEPYGPGAAALKAALAARREAIAADLTSAAKTVEAAAEAAPVTLFVRADRVRTDAASLMRTADLVVIGPPVRDGLYIDDDLFHAALFMSGRPCLVLPYGVEHAPFGRRIVMAWKDCRESARAVNDSLAALRAAEAVALVALKPEEDDVFAGQAALDRIGETLRAHGVKLAASTVAPKRGGAVNALLRESRAFGADLVVMGGYGRSRMSEFLLGGMTRAMLERMEVPLLMSH